MATQFENLVAFLGGVDALETADLRSFYDFDRILRKGLSFRVFEHVVHEMGEHENTIAESLGIPRSTLSRRRTAGRLDMHESERFLRLSTVLSLGRETLGSTAAATKWIFKPNRALGGARPLDLLQTDIGARQVEAVLGRALFGGYS